MEVRWKGGGRREGNGVRLKWRDGSDVEGGGGRDGWG